MTDALPPFHLTPATRDRELAAQWFSQFEGAGLDGIVAKPLDGEYEPDKRVMFKVKHERTADCVVAGYREHKSGPDAIGSLLLGLYDDAGKLASIGVIGAFPLATRRELFTELQPLVTSFEGHPWNWAKPSRGSGVRVTRSTAGGTRTRTCRSSRCAPSGWSRSATTTWRAPGSGTRPSSSGGAPTVTRNRAASASWRSRSAST